jgi:hypothetical protein
MGETATDFARSHREIENAFNLDDRDAGVKVEIWSRVRLPSGLGILDSRFDAQRRSVAVCCAPVCQDMRRSGCGELAAPIAPAGYPFDAAVQLRTCTRGSHVAPIKIETMLRCGRASPVTSKILLVMASEMRMA